MSDPRGRDELAYLLDLAADDGLDPTERVRLEHLLESDRERRSVVDLEGRSARLVGMLRADREVLRPSVGLQRRVMSRLPPAGWEARSRRAWKVPVALLALMVTLSVVLVGTGAETASSTVSVIAGLVDAAVAAVAAGAGVIGASWRGLGMALGEVLAGSVIETGLFALGVVSLNLLLVLLVRRARRGWSRVAGMTTPEVEGRRIESTR